MDFIKKMGSEIVRIEVKSGRNVRARSLEIYREKYNPKLRIKTSMLNVDENSGVVNVSLYMMLHIDMAMKLG